MLGRGNTIAGEAGSHNQSHTPWEPDSPAMISAPYGINVQAERR